MKSDNKILLEMIEEEIENYQSKKEENKKISHDHEGKMAKGELRDMIKNGLIIYKSFDKNDELPGWISSYITLASDYMHSVMEYMVEENSSEQSSEEMDGEDFEDEEVEEPESVDN
jgi:hypothetical protein